MTSPVSSSPLRRRFGWFWLLAFPLCAQVAPPPRSPIVPGLAGPTVKEAFFVTGSNIRSPDEGNTLGAVSRRIRSAWPSAECRHFP